MLVNVPVLFDSAFTNQTVSILGRMGVSSDACLTPLLIAERIVTHEVIAHRAYEISRSAPGGSAEDHWWRAERELLGRDRLQ
jgi:hypothetical protein